jgi:hypothetical protein
MEGIYLITATHADGSRRQWVGKKALRAVETRFFKFLEDQPDADPFMQQMPEPSMGKSRYTFAPLHRLYDCALKDKAITQ